MINYELAKKLKDAGFPQYHRTYNPALLGDGHWCWKYYWDEDNPNEILHYMITGSTPSFPNLPEHTVYIPTLSELIEACGDKFLGLFPPQTSNFNKWLAVKKIGTIVDNPPGMIIGQKFWTEWEFWDGDTPEEAVSALWLKLNDK